MADKKNIGPLFRVIFADNGIAVLLDDKSDTNGNVSLYYIESLAQRKLFLREIKSKQVFKFHIERWLTDNTAMVRLG